MGILLSFLIGYVAGAKAGSNHLDDVVESAKAVRDSEEFGALITSLRTHAGATMRLVADLLSEAADDDESVVQRVQRLMDAGKGS